MVPSSCARERGGRIKDRPILKNSLGNICEQCRMEHQARRCHCQKNTGHGRFHQRVSDRPRGAAPRNGEQLLLCMGTSTRTRPPVMEGFELGLSGVWCLVALLVLVPTSTHLVSFQKCTSVPYEYRARAAAFGHHHVISSIPVADEQQHRL